MNKREAQKENVSSPPIGNIIAYRRVIKETADLPYCNAHCKNKNTICFKSLIFLERTKMPNSSIASPVINGGIAWGLYT